MIATLATLTASTYLLIKQGAEALHELYEEAWAARTEASDSEIERESSAAHFLCLMELGPFGT